MYSSSQIVFSPHKTIHMALRIVFMGTPEFAVPTLDALRKAGHEIVGVITATDKLGGRGKNKLLESAVKKYAVEHGLYVMQPKNLKAPEFVEELRSRKADLQVVVAFRMLPVVVWDMPPMGTLNLHGSLLPKYRGAAPINWAVINGETETGVTTFLLKHEIDTGDLLLQEHIPIGPNDTAGDVHDRMMHSGADVVVRTVEGLENGTIKASPQDESLVSKAPKIFHEMCRVDFDQPARVVHNFIRGLSPFPGAWTTVDGKSLKLLRSEIGKMAGEPGQICITENKYLDICCRGGSVRVHELQLEGKRRMKTPDFLNGYTIESKEAGSE